VGEVDARSSRGWTVIGDEERRGGGSNRPTGEVTFLFTDIVGSTRLWESDPDAMRRALEQHDEIIRTAISTNQGYIFSTGGDGFAVAFQDPVDAARAALVAQVGLAGAEWPTVRAVEVRMGLHTGPASERGGDYFGPTVNRAGRIMSIARGGQTLASDYSASSIEGVAAAVDLGPHMLRDLAEPIVLMELRPVGSSSESIPTAIVDPSVGERRPLTVVALSVPGDNPLAFHAAEIIKRAGGYVATPSGRTVLAYFGYPIAYEDAARRALRAAWDIAELPGAIAAGIRVAVHSGTAEVEPGRGTGPSILGHTLPVAAGLLTRAVDGQVLLSGDTRRIAALHHEARMVEVGADVDRGYLADVYELKASVGEGRRGASSDGVFIGRSSEVALVTDRLELAAQRDGQILTVVGEPGIGKSRLVAHIRGRAEDLGMRWLAAGGGSTGIGAPFAAVAQIVREYYGWNARQDAARFSGDLSTTPGLSADVINGVVAMMALGGSEGSGASGGPKPLARWATEWLLVISASEPIAFIVEDLQWLDAASIDVLQRFATEVASRPATLLVTCRPGTEMPWNAEPNHSLIRLQPLDRGRTRELIVARLGLHDGDLDVSDEAVDRLVERSDGIPLFAEELAGTIRDLGVGGLDDIPATLHDSLIARLDRTGLAKRFAQCGAVVGREFSAKLVAAIHELDLPTVENNLARLVKDELVRRHSGVDGTRYVFRHALIQQAAYDSLLDVPRRDLHRKVAVLLSEPPYLVETDAATLAHHWERAEAFERATNAWEAAGRAAMSASAASDAARFYGNAISIFERMPNQSADQDLQLHALLGAALGFSHGWNSPLLAPVVERMRSTADACTDPLLAMRALQQMWGSVQTAGEILEALSIAEHMLALAQASDDPKLLAQALQSLGNSLMNTGRTREALLHLHRCIDLVDAQGAPALLPFEQMLVRQYAAMAVMITFEDDQLAEELAPWIVPLESVIADDTDQFAVTMAVMALMAAYDLRGDFATAAQYAARLLPLAEASGLKPLASIARISLGRAQFAGGDPTGIALQRQGMDELREQGMMLSRTKWLAEQARMYIAIGDLGAARFALDEGFANPSLLAQEHMTASLWWSRAALAIAAGEPVQDVELYFAQALEITSRLRLDWIGSIIDADRQTWRLGDSPVRPA
jgi:class 3 adenylate cyclase/tetratricopeptide (TPR) repeat protein